MLVQRKKLVSVMVSITRVDKSENKKGKKTYFFFTI